MKTPFEQGTNFGLWREAQRHAAFEADNNIRKAMSPLRFTEKFLSGLSPVFRPSLFNIFGLRREAQRHAAFETDNDIRKALSPLRSATALRHFAPLFLCIFGFLLLSFDLNAATNDLTSALQKGLFEEEANHNLEAAAQAYQNVATQFDKDRKLAATAIFRLGEVYRKQGKTNEAVVQYERIVREFSDQETLASLSRQNLESLNPKDLNAKTGDDRTGISLPDLEDGQIRAIQNIIRNSPDLINAPSPTDQLTPLCRAARDGHLRVAKFLLDSGAEINLSSGSGAPLHHASRQGHLTMVQFLLERGADVNARATGENTALHMAAGNGFLAVAEALVNGKADVNSEADSKLTPLHLAVSKGKTELVRFLVGKGAALEAKCAYQFSYGGVTPLILAAIERQFEAMNVLLESGANPNAQEDRGRTALSFVVQNKSLEAVNALLATKADPNAGELDLPLAMAAKGNALEIAEALLKAGADPNLAKKCSFDLPGPNFQGTQSGGGPFGPFTPLHIAVNRNSSEMVSLLLKFKADPNATDKRFSPEVPLVSFAVQHVEMLKALLEAGADPNARDAKARTLLQLAISYRLEESAEVLLLHKADLNASDTGGNTPLYLAVASFNKPIVEMLLAKGADPNIANNNGESPLGRAKSDAGKFKDLAFNEIAELLREHGALDELPDFSSIRLTREGITPIVVFRKDTNGINRFTVLEVIRNYYPKPELVPGRPEWVNGVVVINERIQKNPTALSFPDFSRIVILRPTGQKPGEQKKIEVSLLNATNGFDPAKDLMLEFGDVVEIPEREHALSESPVGLTPAQDAQLTECLSRKITFVIKDQRHEVAIQGRENFAYLSSALEQETVKRVLLSSSDFSRIKVIRTHPETKKGQEFSVNAQEFISKKRPLHDDLWLRDGDVIEVPDKL